MIWKTLYSTKSSKETGTLYAARNTINARNVTEEPGDHFYASTELLNKFSSAYIICGGLKHFGMVSTDSEPTENPYLGDIGNETEMRNFVLCEAKSFLQHYLDLETPVIPGYGLQNNSKLCRFCNKTYKKVKALRKHESSVHGVIDPLYTQVEASVTSKPEMENDGVLNYTRMALGLGLLRLNHTDAIKMGDGQRIMDINMYLYLLYKINKFPKYAYGILETIAQSKVLLTERLAHRLIWNRTVNHQGKPDTNHPNDLDLEHQNKLFKDQIHNYRGTFTEKSISRVSRSATIINNILKVYDKSVKVFRPSGEHTSANTEEDIATLIKSFQQRKIFDYIPGRSYYQFEDIGPNPFQNLDGDQLRNWISSCLTKYSQEHFY